MSVQASRLVFGFMTGTSLDALDAAAVVVRGAGLACSAELQHFDSEPFGDLGQTLRALAKGEPAAASDFADASLRLGELHARVAGRLVDVAGCPDFCAVHGQTVAHAPPCSLQLVNPWPIALATRRPVVFDLRGADLAAGGQGAPISPVADWALFRSASESRAIVNLGGFCNVTILPCGVRLSDVRAMDVCACNHALDGVARRALGTPFDEMGNAALRGSPCADAVAALRRELERQSQAGRSLGTGDEVSEWVNAWADQLSPGDMAASAVAAISDIIAKAVEGADHVLCAGGSVRNRALMAALSDACAGRVEATDAAGIPASAREAVVMAILGALCADATPITLPHVTGSRETSLIAGAWIDPCRNDKKTTMQRPPTLPQRPTGADC